MENRPPTSGPSVDQVDLIPLDTPIHFRIPMGRGPDVLLSVDGSGKTLRSWPEGPCERRAAMPDVATSFGKGPLILVEVDVDGSYFTRTHLPSCVFRSCPSMQGIINGVCSTLGRPLPFCYQPPYPYVPDPKPSIFYFVRSKLGCFLLLSYISKQIDGDLREGITEDRMHFSRIHVAATCRCLNSHLYVFL